MVGGQFMCHNMGLNFGTMACLHFTPRHGFKNNEDTVDDEDPSHCK